MTFISNSKQAEEILLQNKPVVIVADIAEDNDSGLKLLQTAKDHLPGSIRIGISAGTDESVAIQALHPTHIFMAKPFETNELRAIIQRALKLRQKIQYPQIQKMVSQIEKLPSPPEIYFEINRMLQKDEVSLTDIANMIQKDTNITTQILRIVNSAYFGLFKNVDSVQRAVVLLGFELVKNLILGIDLFQGAHFSGTARTLVNTVWMHSLNVARASMEIVKRDPEQHGLSQIAYSIGILHDVGKLIFIQALKDEYAHLWQESKDNNIPLWQAEKERYGITHADTGAYLLGLWGLPDHLVQAVGASHTNPETDQPGDFLLRVLMLTDAVEISYSQQTELQIPEGLLPNDKINEWVEICRNVFTGEETK